MASLADLLRAAGSGLYGSAGGFIPDTGVSLANLARAAYGYGGSKLGLLAPQDMPDLIDPANVPGTTANVSGLLGVGDSTPEQVAQFAGGLLGPGGKGKAATKLEATVYHGSPHAFDKFDMSKLGTGEGAQAFGHGLYFADNPQVAQSYQKQLSVLNPSGFVDSNGAIGVAQTNAEKAANNVLSHYGWDKQRALASLENVPPKYTGVNADRQAFEDEWNAKLREAISRYSGKNPGNLYTVDIPDAAINSMLHWEKPLSAQPQAVQEALGLGDKEAGLVNAMPDMTGQALYWELSRAMGGPDKASQFLNARGVPGIRYLDAGSRGLGDGTSNTVLFNDQLAQILGRQ